MGVQHHQVRSRSASMATSPTSGLTRGRESRHCRKPKASHVWREEWPRNRRTDTGIQLKVYTGTWWIQSTVWWICGSFLWGTTMQINSYQRQPVRMRCSMLIMDVLTTSGHANPRWVGSCHCPCHCTYGRPCMPWTATATVHGRRDAHASASLQLEPSAP